MADYRRFAPWIAAVLVGALATTGGWLRAADEEETPKSKKAKTAKSLKSDDAEKSDEMPAEESKEEPKEEGGFGSERKPKISSKKKTDSTEGKSKEEIKLDKDKAKLEKTLKSRLGGKEDGFFVVITMETKFERMDPQIKPVDGSRQVAADILQLPPEYEVQVLEGKPSALSFLMEFLGEFPPVEEKKSSKKNKLKPGEQIPLPNPIRDWKMMGAFSAKEKEAAFAMQERTQYQVAAAKKAGKAW
ncbi:MAG: hypothetical protein ACRC1K_18530 [Planctomycetia bacterium]